MKTNLLSCVLLLGAVLVITSRVTGYVLGFLLGQILEGFGAGRNASDHVTERLEHTLRKLYRI